MSVHLNTLKTVATVVGSVAGIVTGVDKVKSTVQKWNQEYKEGNVESEEVNEVPPSKQP